MTREESLRCDIFSQLIPVWSKTGTCLSLHNSTILQCTFLIITIPQCVFLTIATLQCTFLTITIPHCVFLTITIPHCLFPHHYCLAMCLPYHCIVRQFKSAGCWATFDAMKHFVHVTLHTGKRTWVLSYKMTGYILWLHARCACRPTPYLWHEFCSNPWVSNGVVLNCLSWLSLSVI